VDKSVLVVRDISAGYGGPPIINDVCMHAAAGRITALVGPNGAGKSTLLKALAGVLRPQGSILLDGVEVARSSPETLVRGGLSYVPQVANVFSYLNVIENLEIGGYVRRRHGLKERIEEMLTLFPDLRLAARRPARTLSGGQRNMLAMARGLMNEPKVMLLDEPTAGLSPIYVSAVWDHIVLVRNLGVAVVVVEQNTRRTLQHADYAFVLTLGRNRLEGTGAELLNDPEVGKLYIGGEPQTA
jgi:ABC-type branched-subunit amino acid transport system ATPase component